jgi:protoporphyrinogen/coproporphyrinogen III oxidase
MPYLVLIFFCHMKFLVVGGGISSLTVAYYLAKKSIAKNIPASIQVVYKGHLGGWIHSFHKNQVLYETGPRSLRPAGHSGFSTLELISDLNLETEIVAVGPESEAAKNRFVYFDGSLHQLPASLPQLLANRSPVLKGLIGGVLMEPFRPISCHADESIASFIDRRFGNEITDNLVSAVVHGIYAGDVTRLSIRSTLKALWEMEQNSGSIIKDALKSVIGPKKPVYIAGTEKAQKFIDSISKFKMYSFQNGMQTLVDRLVTELHLMNVELIPSGCVSLDVRPEKTLLGLENGIQLDADHVFSGIPAWELSSILSNSARSTKNDKIAPVSSLLSHIEGVDVGVVNLVYDGDVLPHKGFGFLVPRSQVDQCDMIGVVYDSCIFPQQDKKPVTRLNAMMGGHLFASKFGNPKTLDKDTLKTIAVREIEKILGISTMRLMDYHVSIQEKCIPQYIVGHEENVIELEKQLKSLGRLVLLGSSYRGVSVNDCIYNAKQATNDFLQ